MTDTQGRKADAEIAKLIAETSKIVAETSKLNQESFWHPMALATALILVVAVVMKFILF